MRLALVVKIAQAPKTPRGFRVDYMNAFSGEFLTLKANLRIPKECRKTPNIRSPHRLLRTRESRGQIRVARRLRRMGDGPFRPLNTLLKCSRLRPVRFASSEGPIARSRGTTRLRQSFSSNT